MVTCLSNKRVPGALTVGQDYALLCVLENICVSGRACALAYCVECDDGIERVYSAERFSAKPDWSGAVLVPARGNELAGSAPMPGFFALAFAHRPHR